MEALLPLIILFLLFTWPKFKQMDVQDREYARNGMVPPDPFDNKAFLISCALFGLAVAFLLA